MLKAAILGFGGIAKAAHLGAYKALEEKGKAELAAVCDIREECFTKKQEINIGSSGSMLGDSVRCYTNWREMFDKENVDIVDICLPTFLHAQLSVEALNRGFNVLCEKPMGLSYSECLNMIAAANKNKKRLMIGQCLRFGSKYRYLRRVIDDRRFGKVVTATFQRLSTPPVWGWDNWFMDFNRSHGCIQDMHVHDIDLSRYLFGEPNAVSCVTTDVYSHKDSARSTLFYEDFSVLVIGDWTLEGMPFSADYLVSFEKATVEYKNDVITVYPRGGEAFRPDVVNDNFYFNEIEYFVDLIVSGHENSLNPPESAAKTIKLVETLIDSSDSDSVKIAFT